MEFRQKALNQLRAPEDLALPAGLAKPQGRLVLAVLCAVVVAGCVWGVTGTLPRNLAAPGVLTYPQGTVGLQSPAAGQVVDVFVQDGVGVSYGTPVLTVRTDSKVEVIRAAFPGRVSAMLVKVGAVVAAGTVVTTVERIDDVNDEMVAVLYAPGSSGPTIPLGAQVDLTVQSVPAQQFGVLRGRVLDVGRFPETKQQISDFLSDEQLGEQFSAAGRPVKIVVELEKATNTQSGFKWSSTAGPPYGVDSRTLVTGAIRLSVVRPVDWVLS